MIKTPTFLIIGPNTDHTMSYGMSRHGHYLYAEGSNYPYGSVPSFVGRSVIQNPNLKAQCLEFYYHMYGKGIGRLLVSQTTGVQGNVTLLNITGNQGQLWKQATVQLVPVPIYVLSFEAVRGVTFESDIAVDDIAIIDDCHIAPANCTEPEYHQCSNGKCIPRWHVCNNVNDCDDEVCVYC